MAQGWHHCGAKSRARRCHDGVTAVRDLELEPFRRWSVSLREAAGPVTAAPSPPSAAEPVPHSEQGTSRPHRPREGPTARSAVVGRPARRVGLPRRIPDGTARPARCPRPGGERARAAPRPLPSRARAGPGGTVRPRAVSAPGPAAAALPGGWTWGRPMRTVPAPLLQWPSRPSAMTSPVVLMTMASTTG